MIDWYLFIAGFPIRINGSKKEKKRANSEVIHSFKTFCTVSKKQLLPQRRSESAQKWVLTVHKYNYIGTISLLFHTDSEMVHFLVFFNVSNIVLQSVLLSTFPALKQDGRNYYDTLPGWISNSKSMYSNNNARVSHRIR